MGWNWEALLRIIGQFIGLLLITLSAFQYSAWLGMLVAGICMLIFVWITTD